MPPDILKTVQPELVVPLVAYLCHESCQETGSVFEVGGGFVAKLRWQRTEVIIFIFRELSSIPRPWAPRMSPRNGTISPTLTENAITPLLAMTLLAESWSSEKRLTFDPMTIIHQLSSNIKSFHIINKPPSLKKRIPTCIFPRSNPSPSSTYSALMRWFLESRQLPFTSQLDLN